MKKLIRKKFSGLAIVESALMLQLLLLVSLGALRYGHLLLKTQLVTNAARCGAREAIRPDANNLDVEAVVEGMMNRAGLSGLYQLILTPEDVSRLADPPVGVEQPVTVAITVDVDLIEVLRVPLFVNLEPPDLQISASVTMAKEGF